MPCGRHPFQHELAGRQIHGREAAIGDRDQLKFNADGSLDLYIQNENPGPDKESNWLPAPKDEFNLAMRLYSPKREALDGPWTPPPVKRAN